MMQGIFGFELLRYYDTTYVLVIENTGKSNLNLHLKAAYSVSFDLLILEIMFLIFKNTVKKSKIQVYILPIS